MREALNPANTAQDRLSTMSLSTTDQNQPDDMRGRRSDMQDHIQYSPALEMHAYGGCFRSSLQPNRPIPGILASTPMTGQQSSVSQYGYTSERVCQTWVSPQYNQNELSYPGAPAMQPWLEASEHNSYWNNGWEYSLREFRSPMHMLHAGI